MKMVSWCVKMVSWCVKMVGWCVKMVGWCVYVVNIGLWCGNNKVARERCYGHIRKWACMQVW